MINNQIVYRKHCLICDREFVTKRIHAVTCSGRCRFISHKLKKNYNEFSCLVDYDLFELSPNEIRIKQSYIRQKRFLNYQGNEKDFISGYKDIKGNLKILVFKISALKCLEVWNDIGDSIITKYFKYN